MHKSLLTFTVSTLLMMAAPIANSGTVTIPNTFTAGATAKAADVNANFSAVATAVNGSATDIATLQTSIQALQKSLASLSSLGFTFKGPWATATAYAINDVVSEAGSSYVALKANTAVDPANDVKASGGNWAVIASAASVPANLTALSNQLGTSGYASEDFKYAGATCMLGDIVLSVNSYGNGGAMVPADGRLLQISTNTALFSLLGTNFGGDGVSTFALPDLRSFAPKGLQYSICTLGIFPARN